MDLSSGLIIVLLVAIVAVGLIAAGMVLNLVSLARSRRPSALGVRLMLVTPGFVIVAVSLFGFVLFVASPEVGNPAFFVRLVLGLVLGSLMLVGGLQARVSTVRSEPPRATPGARRAVQLLAVYLLPVGALELWGMLSVRDNSRIGLATVSFASALLLLGVFAYARVVKLQSPVRFGSLDGSWSFLAVALVPLIGSLYFLTSLPDRLP